MRFPMLTACRSISPRSWDLRRCCCWTGSARRSGFAVDRGTMFQGITQLSVPVLSPSWQLLLILTAAGHAHDLDGDALGPLSRAMQSAATQLSESVRLLRLG